MSTANAVQLCSTNAALFAAIGVLEAVAIAPEITFGMLVLSPAWFTIGTLTGLAVACLGSLILLEVIVGGNSLRAALLGSALGAVSVAGAGLVGFTGHWQLVSYFLVAAWPFVVGTGALFGMTVRWAYREQVAAQ